MTTETLAPGKLGVSLITPSLNQGVFLNEALRSVLGQNHSLLEYVVMDGGSIDDSRSIIEAHAGRLDSWVSEKDLGQYDAINKGFARTKGDIMGWLNSDDMHCPWTLSVVTEIFEKFPAVEWLTTTFPLRWDVHGRATHCRDTLGYARNAFARGEYCPGTDGFFAAPIQQESTFWRRSLWEKAGGFVSQDFGPAGDFELWCRFAKSADLHAVTVPLAGFRMHGDQQSSRAREEYFRQAHRALDGHFPGMRSPWLGRLRPLARDRAPEFLRPVLASLGLLHPGGIITRTGDNREWRQFVRRV